LTSSSTAFVSIMEGCSKYCSFCVVPYTRGEEISRPLDDVLIEIATLATQGVREITLLGQNVNAYVWEQDGETLDFSLLLEHVADVPGIERIRYTTSHPKEFSQALIDCYQSLPKLVDHVHLPVQSGSDKILEAMKRGYTSDHYREIIRELRTARHSVSIASDFIVGFPGETEKDFEETMRLVEDIDFDGSFSFMYSPRPGTPAAALPNHVPLEVKKTRLQLLQQKLNQNSIRYGKAMVGKTYSVLVEGASKKGEGQLTGRTSNNRVVNFEGHNRLTGHMVDIEITESLANSLKGVLVTR